jgi:hypothetical protein
MGYLIKKVSYNLFFSEETKQFEPMGKHTEFTTLERAEYYANILSIKTPCIIINSD